MIKSPSSEIFRISLISPIGEIDDRDGRRPIVPAGRASSFCSRRHSAISTANTVICPRATIAIGCRSTSSNPRCGLYSKIRWRRPTSPSCGTPASRWCCRWSGTGKPLQRLRAARRQERAFLIRCRPTACWWTMNGADFFRNTRFVWASVSTGRPGFMIPGGEPGPARGHTLASCRGIDTLRRNGVPFHVICVIGAAKSRCGR